MIYKNDSAITVRIRCLRLCCGAPFHMRITAWFLRGSCLIVPCMKGERMVLTPRLMVRPLAIQASHHQGLWAIFINFLHPRHQLPPHPTINIPQSWQQHRLQLPLHNPCPRRVGGADPCPARPLGAGLQPNLQAGLGVGPLPRDSPGKGRLPLTRGWCLTFLRGMRRWTLPSPR